MTATDSVAITGNTYPVKDALRALGCRWDAGNKCWLASGEDMASKARALVAAAPAKTAKTSSSHGYCRRYECEDCGETVRSGTRCWETGLMHR